MINNDIKLVKASIDDAEKIWSMQVKAFASLLEKYQDYDTNPGNETVDKVRQRIEMKNSDYYFIYNNNIPVGSIRVRVMDNGEKRLSPIFILPEYRNQGIAQQAIMEAEKIYGAKHWLLETILEEKGNCYLYEKMGYVSTGKTEVINEKLTLIIYKK